jgi:Ca2+-binding EF-hand superfamily protein
MQEGIHMTIRWAMLLLLCTCLTASMAGAADTLLDKRAVVQSADTNNDSRIDRLEFHQRTTEAYFLIDTNKDGYVIESEFLATVPGANPQRIKAADRNRDGKIDIYEYHYALSQDFDAADTNGDGALDLLEVERLWGSTAR